MSPLPLLTFASNLEYLAGVPGIYARLRREVLNAATEGFLAPSKNSANNRRYVNDIISRTKSLGPSIKIRKRGTQRAEQLSPRSWCTVLLGELAEEISYGTSVKAAETGQIPIIRMGNIQNQRLDLTSLKYVSRTRDIEKLILKPGDLLFNRTNSPALVGKSAVFRDEGTFTFASYLIRARLDPAVNPDFVNIWLGSPKGRAWARRVRVDAIGQSNINGTSLGAFTLSLPIRSEQDAIVQQVDHLLTVIDELESAYANQERDRQELARATFARLATGDTTFAFEKMTELVRTSEDLDEVERAIVKLAVTGRLVIQLDTEGTGHELLAHIRASRRQAPIDTIIPAVHSAYPETWAQCSLGSVVEFCYGKGLASEDRIKDGRYVAYGANGPLARTDKFLVESAGIIVGRKGSAGAVNLVDGPFWPTDVTYFVPEGQFAAFDIHYLFYLLRSLDLPLLGGGIKPGLNRNDAYSLPIGLPPRAEQARIVVKLEKLLGLARSVREALVQQC